MNKEELQLMLEGVKDGSVSVEDAMIRLRLQPYDDLGYAKIDNHRGIRQGAGEVIYGEGKTREQILGITAHMLEGDMQRVLITRMSQAAADFLADRVPLTYDPMSRIGIAGDPPDREAQAGNIVVATGGTSDMPIAEEAALTAEFYGNRVIRLYDVGVSGIHRLMDHTETLSRARVVVAVAGMEGALASVIGGLVDCPVIAVPTSVGYGANLGGISALLSMLNSCASGVSVVNIDNGFGAGYLASMINRIK